MTRHRPIRMKHNKRPVRMKHNRRPPRRHKASYTEIFIWLAVLVVIGLTSGAVVLPVPQLMLILGLVGLLALVVVGVVAKNKL